MTDATPAEIQTVIDAQRKILATMDLVVLQDFATLALNDSTTIGDLRAGVEGLTGALGDPERKAQADALRIAWENQTGQLAMMISMTTAIATDE